MRAPPRTNEEIGRRMDRTRRGSNSAEGRQRSRQELSEERTVSGRVPARSGVSSRTYWSCPCARTTPPAFAALAALASASSSHAGASNSSRRPRSPARTKAHVPPRQHLPSTPPRRRPARGSSERRRHDRGTPAVAAAAGHLAATWQRPLTRSNAARETPEEGPMNSRTASTAARIRSALPAKSSSSCSRNRANQI